MSQNFRHYSVSHILTNEIEQDKNVSKNTFFPFGVF